MTVDLIEILSVWKCICGTAQPTAQTGIAIPPASGDSSLHHVWLGVRVPSTGPRAAVLPQSWGTTDCPEARALFNVSA